MAGIFGPDRRGHCNQKCPASWNCCDCSRGAVLSRPGSRRYRLFPLKSMELRLNSQRGGASSGVAWGRLPLKDSTPEMDLRLVHATSYFAGHLRAPCTYRRLTRLHMKLALVTDETAPVNRHDFAHGRRLCLNLCSHY